MCYEARRSCVKRGIIFLYRSGSIRITPMGTEHKRFDMLNGQRPMSCHLLSVVVVYPSPASTSSLSQVCLGLCYLQITCRKLPAIPYPSFLRRHLGFLHRMGTAEGAVGQASPRLSHPVYSHPPDLTSPSVLTGAPSSTETPHA